MGGCCCCSRGPDQSGTPAYYYCPRVSEEHQPLSADHGASSAFATGLLVDTNLNTSSPDTYRPPPAPLPYDLDFGRCQTPPNIQEISVNKTNAGIQTTDIGSVGGAVVSITTEAKSEGVKESDCKVQTDIDASAKETEVELSKSPGYVSSLEEEDICPTCLEEYDVENPKIITKCDHHFHLACILEWMERSDTCPVCDKEMMFSPPLN